MLTICLQITQKKLQQFNQKSTYVIRAGVSKDQSYVVILNIDKIHIKPRLVVNIDMDIHCMHDLES